MYQWPPLARKNLIYSLPNLPTHYGDLIEALLQSSHMGYEIVRNILRIFGGYWLLTKEFIGEVVISRVGWGEGKVGGWDLWGGRFWRKDHWARLGTLKSSMVYPDGIKKQNKCKTVRRTGRMKSHKGKFQNHVLEEQKTMNYLQTYSVMNIMAEKNLKE